MDQQQLSTILKEISNNMRPRPGTAVSFDQLSNNQQPVMWAQAQQIAGEDFDLNSARQEIPSSEWRGQFYRLASVLPQVESYFLAFFSELSENAADASQFFSEGKLSRGFRGVRVFLETLAVFNQSLRALDKAAEGNAFDILSTVVEITSPLSINLDAVMASYDPATFSEKDLELGSAGLQNFKAKNINGQIRTLSKSACPSGFAAYAALSEFCHPNWGVVWVRRAIGRNKIDPWGLVLQPLTTSTNEVVSQKRKIMEQFQPIARFVTESFELSSELPATATTIKKKIAAMMKLEARKLLPNLIDVLDKKDICICGSNKTALKCCASRRFRR